MLASPFCNVAAHARARGRQCSIERTVPSAPTCSRGSALSRAFVLACTARARVPVHVCVCACACACARVRVYVRACVRVRVCVWHFPQFIYKPITSNHLFFKKYSKLNILIIYIKFIKPRMKLRELISILGLVIKYWKQ